MATSTSLANSIRSSVQAFIGFSGIWSVSVRDEHESKNDSLRSIVIVNQGYTLGKPIATNVIQSPLTPIDTLSGAINQMAITHPDQARVKRAPPQLKINTNISELLEMKRNAAADKRLNYATRYKQLFETQGA